MQLTSSGTAKNMIIDREPIFVMKNPTIKFPRMAPNDVIEPTHPTSFTVKARDPNGL